MLLSDQQKYIISVLKQVKYIRLRQLYSLTVQHYRKGQFEISQHRMDVMLRQLRTGTNFVYFQEDVVCYGKRTVDERLPGQVPGEPLLLCEAVVSAVDL